MKTKWILLLAGIVLFVVSFFLTAVKDASASSSSTGMPGYSCARVTLLTPWGSDAGKELREDPLEYFAVLISGWINPVFLIAVVSLLMKPGSRLGAILRVVLLFMFAACWIVFYKAHLHPYVGYFVWTGAMLLALFSGKLSSAESRI